MAAIIEAERAEAGGAPHPQDAETIRRQLLAAILNEAACVLEDGVARRASDLDVTLVNGYGFPRWRGGPLYWASREDPDRIAADLAALAKAVGPAARLGPVESVLSLRPTDENITKGGSPQTAL